MLRNALDIMCALNYDEHHYLEATHTLMADLVYRATQCEAMQCVLFHGYGANAQNLSYCAQYIHARCPHLTIFVLDGHELFEGNPSSNGRQWFSLEAFESKNLTSSSGYASALQTAIERAAEQVAYRCKKLISNDKPLILAGFSQGAALACHLGLFDLKAVCVLAFSGFYRICRVPYLYPNFWLYHGAKDDIVPLKAMELTQEDLSECGLSVESYIDPNAEHTISTEGLAEAARYICAKSI